MKHFTWRAATGLCVMGKPEPLSLSVCVVWMDWWHCGCLWLLPGSGQTSWPVPMVRNGGTEGLWGWTTRMELSTSVNWNYWNKKYSLDHSVSHYSCNAGNTPNCLAFISAIFKQENNTLLESCLSVVTFSFAVLDKLSLHLVTWSLSLAKGEKSLWEQRYDDCKLLDVKGVNWWLFAGIGMFGTNPDEHTGPADWGGCCGWPCLLLCAVWGLFAERIGFAGLLGTNPTERIGPWGWGGCSDGPSLSPLNNLGFCSGNILLDRGHSSLLGIWEGLIGVSWSKEIKWHCWRGRSFFTKK